MLEIKNLQFQPLTLHQNGNKSLHLGPREKAHIAEADLSAEISTAQKRGLISINPVSESAPSAENTDLETAENNTSKRRK